MYTSGHVEPVQAALVVTCTCHHPWDPAAFNEQDVMALMLVLWLLQAFKRFFQEHATSMAQLALPDNLPLLTKVATCRKACMLPFNPHEYLHE